MKTNNREMIECFVFMRKGNDSTLLGHLEKEYEIQLGRREYMFCEKII